MQITALIQVINYLKELSGNGILSDMYKKLAGEVLEASVNPGKDHSSAIQKEKEELHKFLLSTDPSDWGYSSYSLFERINSGKLFGKPAADHLEQLAAPENRDYKAMYAELNRITLLLSEFSENLNRFKQLYDVIVPAEIYGNAESQRNRPAMMLYFEGGLAVRNIADLERYSRLWDGILDTFYRLTGEVNPALDICNFNDGSIVLGVATEEKTLNAIMEGVAGILASLPDILRIRKIQYELSLLSLQNDLNELLDDEIKSLTTISALETAGKLVTIYFNDNSEADAIIYDIAKSLKQILSFAEKGGKLEFKPLLSTPEGLNVNRVMIDSISIIRELAGITEAVVRTQERKFELLQENETVE